ncbi:helix-turn-helix domain-containing protein [Bordetella pseudohinzii]|uniref:DNA binding domain, excisionase family n=2 Tax=Bordetella pseudohinzii TaxID=1331258 RepID=A0A0M9I695_9BORD|nr:helix-turn-helix domain-containing protein [Bordetella pseudohinzii]CUI65721.1 DNA binding domain%2C excisionase family [Bordetella pseudohinzii]
MAGLLFKTPPFRTEGAGGYLLRLDDSNKLQVRDLAELGVAFDTAALFRQGLIPAQGIDPELWSWIDHVSELRSSKLRVWNVKYSRFCPECLREEPTWLAEWELCYYDACVKHKVWMVDLCSSCGECVSWGRPQMLRCKCGADLRSEPTSEAPSGVINLAAALASKLSDRRKPLCDLKPLRHLDLDQSQRLVRFLGTHLDPGGMRKTAKIHNAARMEMSWPVSSVAAAILGDWPKAFHDQLSAIQKMAANKKQGLSKTFERTYRYIYRGLPPTVYRDVHAAFEQWVAEFWRGGVARRNRRLADTLISQVQWTSAKAAAHRLGVTQGRIRRLVAEGILDGDESVSSAGRRFLMVRLDQVSALSSAEFTEMDLTTATEQLGLGKIRLRELVRLLFPNAYRAPSQKGSTQWRIRRGDVDAYLAIGLGLPEITVPEESQVSLSHVLRYWTWSDDEVVELVEAVRDGTLVLEGLLPEGTGLARWTFDRKTLQLWRQQRTPALANWFSIPKVAELLGMNQEAAYWLVRHGFLKAEPLMPKRGCGARVTRSEVERFRQDYVFATEIAEALKTRSTKVVRTLAEMGMNPASSRGLEKCGKVFYARTREIEDWLVTLGVQLPSMDRG